MGLEPLTHWIPHPQAMSNQDKLDPSIGPQFPNEI